MQRGSRGYARGVLIADLHERRAEEPMNCYSMVWHTNLDIPETVPEAIVAQLADGGRLAAGVIEAGVCRLCVGRRAGEGFGLAAFADADAAPLPGFAPPPAFRF